MCVYCNSGNSIDGSSCNINGSICIRRRRYCVIVMVSKTYTKTKMMYTIKFIISLIYRQRKDAASSVVHCKTEHRKQHTDCHSANHAAGGKRRDGRARGRHEEEEEEKEVKG